MSRITETTNVTIKEELVAPRIVIEWNPTDDTGTVHWHITKEVWVGGEYKGFGAPTDVLHISLDECLEYVFDVPLPDGTTTQMPAAMIFLGMKAAFDRLGPLLLARRDVLLAPPTEPAATDPSTEPSP